MIEIFKNANYDFLGKKWLFIGLSCLILLAGAASVVWRTLDGNPNTHAFNLGIDFTGGTLVKVRFKEPPNLDQLRVAIVQQDIESSKITLQAIGEQVGQAPKNEVLVRLPNLREVARQGGQSATAAQATADADIEKRKILAALSELNDPATRNKPDLNLIGRDILREKLLELDPLNLRGDQQVATNRYAEISARIIDYRERERSGLLESLAEVKTLSGIEPQVGAALEQHFFVGGAALRSAEAISPQISADLRDRAIYVTLAACAGMLIYVAFRFKSWGYGLGAVVAVFHDVLITLVMFSVMQWEVDLNLIGALLSLIGFSMNDTIVIFDRVREMRGLKMRLGLEAMANRAINETLSRTVLTNGTTFLATLSLILFGGEVLKGFSWALFIGVIVGTYSTLYIASPFMLWWEGRKERSQTAARTDAQQVEPPAEDAIPVNARTPEEVVAPVRPQTSIPTSEPIKKAVKRPRRKRAA